METVRPAKPLSAFVIGAAAFVAGLQLSTALLGAASSSEMSSTAALASLVLVLWSPILVRNLSASAPDRIAPWMGVMACTLGFAFQAIS